MLGFFEGFLAMKAGRVVLIVVGALAAVALFIGGIAAAGYYKGKQSVYAELKAAQDEINRLSQEARDKGQSAESKIVEKIVEKIVTVHTKGETIIKEVPVYVSKEADSACIVPYGFVSVYDTAVRLGASSAATQDHAPGNADPDNPGAEKPMQPPQWAGEPSPVQLSQIATINAQNMQAFHLLKAQHDGLQEWVKERCYSP